MTPAYLTVDGITYKLKIDKFPDGYALSYDGLAFGVSSSNLPGAYLVMGLYLTDKGLV